MYNIMVVIYASLIRLPIVKNLIGAGNNVFEAIDANSAFIKIASNPINCVIIDLNLPGITNGLELLRKIKRDHPNIKIIIINSNLGENVIPILRKVGIENILNTPVNLDELSNVISEG